jgi:hypothetical protein
MKNKSETRCAAWWKRSNEPKGEFMKRKQEKKKSEMFDGLKQSLCEALAYECGEKVPVRVSQLPPPPKPLTGRSSKHWSRKHWSCKH